MIFYNKYNKHSYIYNNTIGYDNTVSTQNLIKSGDIEGKSRKYFHSESNSV